jgi:hypothetical protein
VLLLLLYGVGRVIFGHGDWYSAPGIRKYAFMLAAGLSIGIAVEWAGVHLANRWEYTPAMPLLPWIDVGLAPIAQMLLLPPLILWAARRVVP